MAELPVDLVELCAGLGSCGGSPAVRSEIGACPACNTSPKTTALLETNPCLYVLAAAGELIIAPIMSLPGSGHTEALIDGRSCGSRNEDSPPIQVLRWRRHVTPPRSGCSRRDGHAADAGVESTEVPCLVARQPAARRCRLCAAPQRARQRASQRSQPCNTATCTVYLPLSLVRTNTSISTGTGAQAAAKL